MRKTAQIIDPYQIETNKFYTLTINPSNQYQSFQTKNRINNFRKNIDLLFFDKLKGDHIGCIEVSRKGRLHYHGCIRWRNKEDILDLFINHIDRLLDIGHIEIDKIEDMPKWIEYYKKSNVLFETYKDKINVNVSYNR